MADNPAAAFSPLSMVTNLGGDLIGGLINYYGIQEQKREGKKTRDLQMRMYDQSRSDSLAMDSRNFLEDKRRYGLESQTAAETRATGERLANRGYDIQERGQEASIEESKAARADALKQKRLEDKLAMLGVVSKFMNTPQVRSQYAQLWGGR